MSLIILFGVTVIFILFLAAKRSSTHALVLCLSVRLSVRGQTWISHCLVSLWQLMTAYDNFWQLLTTFDNFWQLLTTFDNFWQILTNFDKFWKLLTTYTLVEIRPITIGILGFFLLKSIYLDCNQIMDRFIQRTKKQSILLTNWFWNFDSPSKILSRIQTNCNQPVTWYSFINFDPLPQKGAD